MSSNNLATVAVFEPAERAVRDLHTRFVDVVARGLRVAKNTQMRALNLQRHGRHLDSAKLPGKVRTSMHMAMIKLDLFSGRGSLGGVLLMLAVLITLNAGDPSPVPTPIPIPF